MRNRRPEAWWEYERASLWVLPGASMIAALVLGALLSKVQVSMHSSLHHLLFQGTEDDARNLLIGIMGAVITIIALVLGLTLLCALAPLPLGDYQVNGSRTTSRLIVHAPASPPTSASCGTRPLSC